MKGLILLLSLVLSGCYVYPDHIKEANRACKELDGLLYINPHLDGDITAQCMNGYEIIIEADL